MDVEYAKMKDGVLCTLYQRYDSKHQGRPTQCIGSM